MATIALHNFLRSTALASYCPVGYVDSEGVTGDVIPKQWRNERNANGLTSVSNLRGQRSADEAINMRDALKDYVNSDAGSVSWQNERVFPFG